MADADKKMRGPVDKRVYPGAPAQGSAEDGKARDGGPKGARFQILARAVFAGSLALVIGSGAYFALRPSPVPEPQQVGSAAFAADADDARAEDEAGRSKVGLDQDDKTNASASVDDDTGKADGSSAGSGAFDEDAQGQSAERPGSSSSSGSSDGQAVGKPGASSGSGSGSSGQQDASLQAPATISVNVTVDSSSVGGSVSSNSTVELAPSSTAYDALCATGLSVNSRNSAFGVYVAGIGGLSEFDHGGGSGWKYKVNGTFPGHSASAHELHDGDSVVWVYVTG